MTCHWPSLVAMLDLIDAWPVGDLNMQLMKPLGCWNLTWPPAVLAWPFWIMLPNFSVERNRNSTEKLPVPGSSDASCASSTMIRWAAP